MSAARVAFAPATGAPVVVEVPAPAHAFVAALFPDDQAPDPGGPGTLVLREGADGYELRGPGGPWSAAGLPDILTRLELSLAEILVSGAGIPGLHAAGVVVGGGGVLLAGPGESGKSSLAAGFARRGAALLGDDVVLLDGSGRAHPFRRLVKVEEPARTVLGLPPPPPPLDALWPEAAFYHPRALGSRWADPTPVRAVVLPTREDGAGVELDRRSAGDVLARLLPGLVMVERVDAAAFEAVAAAVDGADCWELRFGETPAALQALRAALRQRV